MLKNAMAVVCLTFFAGTVTVDAAERQFSLEQILSSPFPSDLTAAPNTGEVAWVFYDQGHRNVWLAAAPDYRPRQLTGYGDDGQEVSDLAFTADGRQLVYVRGGDRNRAGEIPNPLSLADEVEQAIWIVASDGSSEPRRLAAGHSPAVAPTGDRVAFLRKGQVWSVPLDGSAEAEQLLHVRGNARSLRWSPDGTRLAFVSERKTHSFVGVLKHGRVRWMDPSVDRDSNPVWSPDGERIAFLRIAASSRRFAFGPRREGQPWSIRIADADTGKGREVWQAEAGRGSVFRSIVADNQLFWAEGHGARIVFPWERDGWTHLYSVSLKDRAATLLTPGDFEVEHVSLSPDRGTILYSSNQDDIDRRDLWKVPVASGRPTRLTAGDGIEWSPTPLSDGSTIALVRSDAQLPARPALMSSNGKIRDLAPDATPADFPSDQLVEPQPVRFAATDGMLIPAQLFLPRDHTAGERHPAVIFFHGGSRRQMLLGWHYRHYYHNTYAINQYLANRGFVVLAVNYRSGIGYGLDFREALDYGATGASEFNDVQGAGLYLRNRAEVDPERIGLWGGSYGGYLTALGLARASDLFAVGVDLVGVHDWNIVIRNFVPDYDPAKQQAAARLAFESSPLAHVDTWKSPVLLIHGDDDRNVPFGETVRLAEALRKQGVEFEQLIYPDETHDILIHRRVLESFGATVEFLERHLK